MLQKNWRPEWLISGEKGKSYIDNGMAHRSNSYALTIDIKSFYDNCKREYVYRFFKEKLLTSPDVAEILTNIVTYNGLVPTGCPTSQIIAYYAYEDMFNEIATIAKEYCCTFTLYVDDMAFSSTTPFDYKKLSREIDIALRKYGHKPKYKKVKYYKKGAPITITGTVIDNHSLLTPNSLQNTIFNEFQALKNKDRNKLITEESEVKKVLSLKGKICAARNIEPNKFPEIKRLVNQYSLKIDNNSSNHFSKKSKRIHIKQNTM